jgi:hypothetical protein
MTHIINPQINPRQKNIIIGTILGGSSIVKPSKGKNCYLSMRSKDIKWLKYKANELKNLASSDPITVEKTNRWHSICYPIFNDFESMFYKDGNRKLDIDSLNLLQELPLAVWYVDCGKLIKNKIILNTHIWGEEGSQKIVDYLNSLEWNSEIILERKNYRVKIDESSSKEFLQMCKSNVPDFI